MTRTINLRARTEVLRGAKWRAQPNPSYGTRARAHRACSAARCSVQRAIPGRGQRYSGAPSGVPGPTRATGLARVRAGPARRRAAPVQRATSRRGQRYSGGAKWRARPNPSDRTDARAHWACSEARCSYAAREPKERKTMNAKWRSRPTLPKGTYYRGQPTCAQLRGTVARTKRYRRSDLADNLK